MLNTVVPILDQHKGTAVVSSKQVAEDFKKNHKEILRDIRILIGGAQNCADLFEKTTYIHEQNNQEYPMYLMNRDGFTLLAMGFTGNDALQWKLKYIEAFNEMEKTIKEKVYQVPTNPMQALELMFQAQKETNDKVVLIENDVQDLKENKLLPSSQYEYIRKLICKRVYCIKEIHNIVKAKPLYKAINHDLNRFIGVRTRTQFKEKHFDKAIKFIEEWTPSYTDLELIKLAESF